jgi:hypothetical protein
LLEKTIRIILSMLINKCRKLVGMAMSDRRCEGPANCGLK